MDRYAAKRARVARMISLWNSGTITLTRTTPGDPEPETPWIPGEPETEMFTLHGRVDGVAADHVDDTLILASDLVAIVSPQAVDEDGVTVLIEPRMSDTINVDGEEKTVKKIDAVPASGPAAMFHIFIAS